MKGNTRERLKWKEVKRCEYMCRITSIRAHRLFSLCSFTQTQMMPFTVSCIHPSSCFPPSLCTLPVLHEPRAWLLSSAAVQPNTHSHCNDTASFSQSTEGAPQCHCTLWISISISVCHHHTEHTIFKKECLTSAGTSFLIIKWFLDRSRCNSCRRWWTQLRIRTRTKEEFFK